MDTNIEGKIEKYLAHKNEKNEEDEIKDHCMRVANLAGKFASKFDAEDFGRQCGKAHDIGKYSEKFQRRIRGANIRVDHSSFGAKTLLEKHGDWVSALCVAGHHTGLPDLGVAQNSSEMKTLYGRLQRELPDASAYQKDIELEKMILPSAAHGNDFNFAFFTRMVFSCLVDADFLDTEKFMKSKNKVRSVYPSLKSLQRKLAVYMKQQNFDTLDGKDKINLIRAEVLQACREHAKSAPGLFTLSAPTGSGKTLSSLSFALDHAIEHGKDRIIYVVPYCSIIDQTVAIFEKILEKNAILAHYSGSNYDVEDESNETFDMKKGNAKKLAAENWDMPIIVTTAVQFFESLYASKPSKCRKIHHIANSVVIFDEGQILPHSYLSPCMQVVKQLVQHYSTTALFMSATQPNFNQLLCDEENQPLKRTEIVPNVSQLTMDLARNNFCDLGEIELTQLGERLKSHIQVLCIVNTRKNGAALLEKVGRLAHTYLLTTLLSSKDRKKMLEEIKTKLTNNEPCCVISTSLIEAGVDIDFPVVYRELIGLDSIIQAAGRCNRQNKRPKAASFVYIFSVPEFNAEKFFSKEISATKTALSDNSKWDTPETIEKYFANMYVFEGLDRQDIIKAFNEGIGGSRLPFRTVAEKFHLIEDKDAMVYIPCSENETLLLTVREGAANRATFRKLGCYAASVPRSAIGKIKTEQIDEDSYILLDSKCYKNKYGLEIY